MGNSQGKIEKIGFEDVQHFINTTMKPTLINTLPTDKQACLIPNTVSASQEESIINNFLKSGNTDVKIIVYGSNCIDNTMFVKYNQLVSLGFKNIYIYAGGMFEWLLLQDVFGFTDFPTTIKVKELDFLKYKTKSVDF